MGNSDHGVSVSVSVNESNGNPNLASDNGPLNTGASIGTRGAMRVFSSSKELFITGKICSPLSTPLALACAVARICAPEGFELRASGFLGFAFNPKHSAVSRKRSTRGESESERDREIHGEREKERESERGREAQQRTCLGATGDERAAQIFPPARTGVPRP